MRELAQLVEGRLAKEKNPVSMGQRLARLQFVRDCV